MGEALRHGTPRSASTKSSAGAPEGLAAVQALDRGERSVRLTAALSAAQVHLPELAPAERREVTAPAKSRLLLLLTPWPGNGHPGAMTIREKLYARRHSAKRRWGVKAARERPASQAGPLRDEKTRQAAGTNDRRQ
jgi:hypothetical protein